MFCNYTAPPHDSDDITNVIDFFIKPGSSFITGQVIYLGGV